jgi:heme oxygenase (biliverdin-IX-beta and delta-forming)
MTSNDHAAARTETADRRLPEPSFAERARTLVYLEATGSLSTLSRKQPGFPYGSVMPYALDDCGRPLFLISTMAMHTQNLQSDSRASLLVADTSTYESPLAAARVTLLGNVLPVTPSEVAAARKFYLVRHPKSNSWVDFDDFSFYRMNVVDVYYVGGFGVMGWLTASEYLEVNPDPLADAAAGIIKHMNADHGEALILLARVFAGIEAEQATMTSVDRLGFHVQVKASEGMRGARIVFLREVTKPGEVRALEFRQKHFILADVISPNWLPLLQAVTNTMSRGFLAGPPSLSNPIVASLSLPHPLTTGQPSVQYSLARHVKLPWLPDVNSSCS